MEGAVAVLDIGKTNVKVALFDTAGALLWERTQPNVVLPAPPYPHADVETIWRFFLGALRKANAAHRISAIVPTTHGCAGALIGEDGLLLPVLDYEFAGVADVDPIYDAVRPPFSQTLSPNLPVGLNLGRQIAWQKQRFPEAFAKASAYLTYPQYWAWRLSGVAASEATMLGAHSDLYLPREGRFSGLVDALELRPLLPPFAPSWRRLGDIKREVAAETGLDGEVGVLCGVHDSNASLLPHLATREPPFTIVSSGTWVIIMAVGLGVERLRESDDMLANVDVEGRPVATARFMGGREYAEIVGRRAGNPDAASIARTIRSGAMALPCFAGQGGPFATRKGEVHGNPPAEDIPAVGTLYLAVMTDLMLARLGADNGPIIVEGSFATNPEFRALLAQLRPGQEVFAGGDGSGTARGAALLAQWPPRRNGAHNSSRPAQQRWDGLEAYRAAWRAAVE